MTLRKHWKLIMGVAVVVIAFGLGRATAYVTKPFGVVTLGVALSVGIVAGVVHEYISRKVSAKVASAK